MFNGIERSADDAIDALIAFGSLHLCKLSSSAIQFFVGPGKW